MLQVQSEGTINYEKTKVETILTYISRLVVRNDTKTTTEWLDKRMDMGNTASNTRAGALDTERLALPTLSRSPCPTEVNDGTNLMECESSAHDYQPALQYRTRRMVRKAAMCFSSHIGKIRHWTLLLAFWSDEKIPYLGAQYLRSLLTEEIHISIVCIFCQGAYIQSDLHVPTEFFSLEGSKL